MKPSSENFPDAEFDTTLGYAPGAPLRRRKRIRRMIAGLVLIAAIFAGWKWGPAAADRATLLYWQRQCVTFEPPAGGVLYEPDPAKAAALISGSPDYQPSGNPATSAYFYPRCQRKFEPPRAWTPVVQITHAEGAQFGPVTLLLHGMKTPSGKDRLIFVESSTFVNLYAPAYDIDFRIYERASIWSAPRQINPSLGHAYGGPYAPSAISMGKMDPADPSHFAISYTYKGQTGTIDGRLTDADTIDFTVRDGPAKR